MAPPINQLLKTAKTLNAERLVLEAGKNAFVCTNTGTKDLTRTQLVQYDIFMLLSPIMPEANEMALAQQSSTEFEYLIDGVGEFNVAVTKDGNGLKVIFKRAGAPAELSSASAEPASAPPVPPTAQQAAPPAAQSESIMLPPTVGRPSKEPAGAAPLAPHARAPLLDGPPPEVPSAPPALPALPLPPSPAQLAAPPAAQAESVMLTPTVARPSNAPDGAAPLDPQARAPLLDGPPLEAPSAPPAPPAAPLPPSPAQQAAPPAAQAESAMLTPTVARPSNEPDGAAPLDPQARAPLLDGPPLEAPPAPPAPPASTGSSAMSRTMSSTAQTTEGERLKTEVDRLLERTFNMRGSDLHLATGAPPIVRRFGSLVRLEGDPLDIAKVRRLIRDLLTDEQFSRFEQTNDLDFSYEVAGVGRFRGNALRQYRGLDLTFHVLPAEIRSPEELGLPASVRDVTRHHQGLILVTGPAGQGKSTTISSLVDVINGERPLHIITVEDPIEFVHPIDKRAVVNQREVGRHTHSFAAALRAALREDPDVIVVGELRDLETISLAITAAETGHLVMGTLMTSSAHQTVDRVLESFPPSQQNQIRAMLSESLRAVISQRLLPSADDTAMVLAAEILLGTPAVANLIREKRTFQIPSVMQTSRNLGMRRMDDALIDLVLEHKITPQKGLAFALDKKAFEVAIAPR